MDKSRNAAQEAEAVALLCAVTGLSTEDANHILKKVGGVHGLAKMPEHELMELPGVGPKRARQIRAMTEWALLLDALSIQEKEQIRSPADIANLLMLEMGLLDQEELRVVLLNTKNEIITVDTIYKGSVNTAVVRISEVLREAIRRNCPNVVLVHNHPSGDPTPSPEDVRVTEMVREAGKLLDIEVLDHIIIGMNRYLSLKERGLGFGID